LRRPPMLRRAPQAGAMLGEEAEGLFAYKEK